MNTRWWHVVFLTLVLANASCSGKGDGGQENSTGAAQSGQADQTDSDAHSTPPGEASPPSPESIAKLLQEIEDEKNKLPRDRIDPRAVVGAAREPSEIVAWMRENTQQVAYEGSLRGPLGVLMDRRGNSLDRSLLLARLLEVAGHDVRVVGSRLSANDAKRILADSAGMSAIRDQEDGTNQVLKSSEQAAAIATTILAKAGPLTVAEPLVESTHYWVQYQDGDSWVDADPTLENVGLTQPGSAGKVLQLDSNMYESTSSQGNRHDASPLLHTVDLRLTVERWEAGKLVQSELTSMQFNPVNGPLSPATVTFVPVDTEANKAVRRVFANGAELRDTLLGETAWAPVVWDDTSGWRMVRQFNDAGIISDLPAEFDGTARLGGAATSKFGNFSDAFGGGEEEAEAPTVLTAVIADYEIRAPGRPAEHVRRFIFDSIGPEARRSARPLPRPYWTEQQLLDRGAGLAAVNDTLVAFASPAPEAYLHNFAQRLIDSKDALMRLAAGASDSATLEQAANGLSFRTLEFFAAMRDSTLNSKLAIVEPQVFRRIIRYVPNTNGAMLDVQVSADLAWNRLASAIAANAKDFVTQGVLDSLQESAIALGGEPTRPGQATAALFEEAAKQKIGIVTVKNAADDRLAGYPTQAREWMLRDLSAGHVLVTPAKPVMIDGQPRLGWWRVDPDTSQTVSAMDTGLQPYLVNYSVQIATASGIVVTFFGRAGPAAQQWAAHMRSLQPYMFKTQFMELLHKAQSSINATGNLPPW